MVTNFGRSKRFHLSSSRQTSSSNPRPERRNILNRTEIHWRYQNYRYILGCNVGENIDDYWNADGDRELSDTWTGFTRFTFLNEKPPDGYTWSRATDNEANDIQARLPVSRDLERHVRSVETKREAKVGNRKTEAWQCKKIARYLLHWSRRCGVQGNYLTCL